MRVSRHQDYPVTAGKLLEALTHRDYFQWRLGRSSNEDFHFDAFEETPEGLLIRVHRHVEIKADRVPAVAKRFLDNSSLLVTEFLWTEREQLPYRGRYRFHISGGPVTVAGDIRIEEIDGEARQHISVEVTSSVPLVGRKLVAMVGERVEKALDADYHNTLRFLSQQD